MLAYSLTVGYRPGFYIKCLITAKFKDLGIYTLLWEELLIFRMSLIATGTICLNTHVGKRSIIQLDDFVEKNKINSIP